MTKNGHHGRHTSPGWLRVDAEIPVATEGAWRQEVGPARQKSFVINTASLARSMPFLAREKVNADAEGFILDTADGQR